MGRKTKIVSRKRKPDSVYQSELISRFINGTMLDGKKSVAEKNFYGAFQVIKDKFQKDPLEVFQQAMENVKPVLEVKSRRVGGATYQVPVEVKQDRRTALAIRWIVGFARARKGKPFRECLAAELMDAYQKQGAAIKKKQNVHKMAEANKAIAHYRW